MHNFFNLQALYTHTVYICLLTAHLPRVARWPALARCLIASCASVASWTANKAAVLSTYWLRVITGTWQRRDLLQDKNCTFSFGCSELQWTAVSSGLLVSITLLPPHTGSQAKVANGAEWETSDIFAKRGKFPWLLNSWYHIFIKGENWKGFWI